MATCSSYICMSHSMYRASTWKFSKICNLQMYIDVCIVIYVRNVRKSNSSNISSSISTTTTKIGKAHERRECGLACLTHFQNSGNLFPKAIKNSPVYFTISSANGSHYEKCLSTLQLNGAFYLMEILSEKFKIKICINWDQPSMWSANIHWIKSN